MNYLAFFPLTIFYLLFIQESALARTVMPESAQQECGVCHYEWHPDHSIKDNPDRIPQYIGAKRYVADEWICYSCHDGSMADSRAKVWGKKISHPIKVVPSNKVTISKKYPLYFMNNFAYEDEDGFYGELDCGSCHTAHAVGVQDGVIPERACYLRAENKNSEMCVDCHGGKIDGPKEGTHPIGADSIPFTKKLKDAGAYSGDKPNKMICESCHMVHSAEAENLLLLPIRDAASSELCEACHTDSSDTHPVNVPQKKAAIPYRWSSGSSSTTGKDKSLICVSCHSTHSAVKGTRLLADNNINSSFCETCHMDKLNNTHPVHVSLTEKPNNLVTCESCHKVHNAADSSANDGTDGKIMIVSNKNSGLCHECHAAKYESGSHPVNLVPSKATIPDTLSALGAIKGVEGRLVCESCHKIHNSTPKTRNLLVENKFSELCNTCHENKTASGMYDSAGSIKHPVNIVSDKVKIAEDIIQAGGALGPNKEIICATCHVPHKGLKNTPLLIVQNTQSSICLDCHTDKKPVVYSDHNLVVTAPAELNIQGQTAEQSGVCASCHLSHGWAKKLSGSGDFVTQLCTSCHNSDGAAGKKPIGKYSHPTDRLMKKADGTTENILCTSCHDPHVWDPNRLDTTFSENIEGDFTNSFLRKPNDVTSGLCRNCHEDKFFVENTEHDLSVTAPDVKNIEEKASFTGGICSPCHVVHNGTGPRIWARDTTDVPSKLCFSCHSAGKCSEKKQVGEFSHPVDAALTNTAIVPMPSVPIFDNKVRCYSCHDPHVWDPLKKKTSLRENTEGNQTNSFLRIPNYPSPDLCKDCHQKQVLVEGTDHDLANTAPSEKNFEGNARKAGGVCSPCHVVHNGTGPRIWARDTTDVPSKLCFSCHSGNKCAEKKQVGKFSHPVDVPIAKVGGVTVQCYSCHDPHIWDSRMDTKGGAKENIEGTALNSFLRLPSDPEAALCKDCHIAQGFVVGTDHDMKVSVPEERNMLGQAVLESGPCGACHVPHNAVAEKLWAKRGNITPLCNDCHDSSGCANTKLIGITHPIGVNPPSIPPFSKGDTVTCSTCHNLHQWTPDKKENGPGIKVEGDARNSFLRKLNANSELCTTCHLNQKYVVNTEHDMRVTAESEKNIINQTVEEGGPCSACHIPHNAFEKLLIWAKMPQIDLETPSMLCRSCHAATKCAAVKIPAVDSHPTDIIATNIGRRVERELGSLPLFNKNDGRRVTSGIVSCGSCHNPHQWAAGKPDNAPGENTEGTASNSFLRQKDFTLCADCHRFDTIFRYKYYHIPRMREVGRGLE